MTGVGRMRLGAAAGALIAGLAGPGGHAAAQVAGEQVPARAPIECGGFYEVQGGDTLREIAILAYGTGQFRPIFDANQDTLTAPSLLYVGQRLFVPCLDGSGPATREEALAADGGSAPQPAEVAEAAPEPDPLPVETDDGPAAAAAEPPAAAPASGGGRGQVMRFLSADEFRNARRDGSARAVEARPVQIPEQAPNDWAIAGAPQEEEAEEPAPAAPAPSPAEVAGLGGSLGTGASGALGALGSAAAPAEDQAEGERIVVRTPSAAGTGPRMALAPGAAASGTAAPAEDTATTGETALAALGAAPANGGEPALSALGAAAPAEDTEAEADEGPGQIAALGTAVTGGNLGALGSDTTSDAAARDEPPAEVAAATDGAVTPSAAPAEPTGRARQLSLSGVEVPRTTAPALVAPAPAPPPPPSIAALLVQPAEEDESLDGSEIAALPPREEVAAVAAAATRSNPGASIRFLTGSDFQPFTDQDLREGGMITDLVRRAIAKGAPDRDSRVTFINDWAPHLTVLLPEGAFDLGFPWYKPDCARIGKLSPSMAKRCTDFHFSQPFYEIVIGFYSGAESGLANTQTYGNLFGLRLCRPRGYFTFDLEQEDLVEPNIVMVTPDTPEDCFRLLSAGAVDVVTINVLLAEEEIQRQALTGKVIEMVDLASIQTLHVIASKRNPLGRAYLAMINKGLREMRSSGEWFTVVQAHLREHAERKTQ